MRITTYVIIALILLVFAGVGTCSFYKSQGERNLSAMNDTLVYFRNSIGKLTASMATVQADKKTLKEIAESRSRDLKAMAKEFRKVQSITVVSAPLFIPKSEVKFEVPLPCPEFVRHGKKSDDKWFRFSYNLTRTGISLDSVHIPDTLNVINGIKRKWLFGRVTPTTDLTTSSPYSKPVIIFTAQESQKKSLLRDVFIFLLGTATGAAAKSL